MVEIESKWVWAGGFAAGLAGVAASDCSANVDYTAVNQPVNASNPVVNIDFAGDGTPPLAVEYSSTYGLTLDKTTFTSDPDYITTMSESGVVAALPFGESIDSTGTYDSTGLTPNGAELNNADGVSGQFVPTNPPIQYIGVEFDPGFPVFQTTDYGWIGIEVTDDSSLDSLSAIVTDYAYDDSGAAITAGETPEPSSLALLALGAVGLLVYRRRTPFRT